MSKPVELTLDQMAGILEVQIKTWRAQLDEGKKNTRSPHFSQIACLAASICDAKDDLKKVRYVKRKKDHFEDIFNIK